jgi:hypothetical protein
MSGATTSLTFAGYCIGWKSNTVFFSIPKSAIHSGKYKKFANNNEMYLAKLKYNTKAIQFKEPRNQLLRGVNDGAFESWVDFKKSGFECCCEQLCD